MPPGPRIALWALQHSIPPRHNQNRALGTGLAVRHTGDKLRRNLRRSRLTLRRYTLYLDIQRCVRRGDLGAMASKPPQREGRASRGYRGTSPRLESLPHSETPPRRSPAVRIPRENETAHPGLPTAYREGQALVLGSTRHRSGLASVNDPAPCESIISLARANRHRLRYRQ